MTTKIPFKKVPASRKKKPITTWLTPTEIAKLKSMGHNAQDGIRLLVKRIMKSTTASPSMKKSRSEGSPSITEILYLPLESKKLVSRRITKPLAL